MRGCNSGHGQNGDEILDLPVIGDKRRLSKDNHADNEYQREDHGEFELDENVSKWVHVVK